MLVFAPAPELGHLLCVDELELAVVVGPLDNVVVLVAQEKLQEKLPKGDVVIHAWKEKIEFLVRFRFGLRDVRRELHWSSFDADRRA